MKGSSPLVTVKLSDLRHIRDTLMKWRDQNIPQLRNLLMQVMTLYDQKKAEAMSPRQEEVTHND